MKIHKRAAVIVIDSLGIGTLPDAARYGDEGSHTLDNTSMAVGGLRLRCLASMGLGLIEGVETVEGVEAPVASYGRMKEASVGRDTTTGHWEMAGVVVSRPFATYPEGFPSEIMDRFVKRTGYGFLWAKPASGTEVIQRLGTEHMETGKPIVYTSADSVFQIAAHEDVIPVDELYRICRAAREFLDDYNICRVIARPFTGRPGSFRRTVRRRDFSMEPPGETLLDRLKGRGLSVVGVGKIGDIYAHRGLTEEIHASGNMEVLDGVAEAMAGVKSGLILANLVDFDMLYGHRNDAIGYARALEEADSRIAEIKETLGDDDMLVVTADHGCDPTTPSTDHSREYVPLLVCGRRVNRGVDLGTRESFSDLGQTICGFFGAGRLANGTSFLDLLVR